MRRWDAERIRRLRKKARHDEVSHDANKNPKQRLQYFLQVITSKIGASGCIVYIILQEHAFCITSSYIVGIEQELVSIDEDARRK